MRFERITVQNLMPTGNYLNIRLGADLLLDENDDPKEAMKAALELTKEFHKEQFPLLYKDDKPIFQGEEEIPPIQGKKIITTMGFSAYCDKINSCTTIEELQSMKPIADMNPKLVNVYNEKFKTFQS